jgi:hypothetical protein
MGIKKDLETVLERLHKGIDTAALRGGKEVVPHSSLDYVLKAIEASGIIYKDTDGKWYYTWKKEEEELRKEYQNYKNLDECKIMLNHSKKLVKGVISQKEPRAFDFDIGAWMEDDNFKFFIQHLRYGYPDIYKSWEKIEKSQTDMVNDFSEFYKKVKDIVLEKGFKIKELPGGLKPRYESGFMYKKEAADLKERIHLIPANVRSPLETFLNNLIEHNAFENEIEEVIENCISSEQVVTLYDKFLYPLEYNAVDLDKFLLELQPIIIGVLEDGEPLRGSCDRCPKTTIGRKENKKEGLKSERTPEPSPIPKKSP